MRARSWHALSLSLSLSSFFLAVAHFLFPSFSFYPSSLTCFIPCAFLSLSIFFISLFLCLFPFSSSTLPYAPPPLSLFRPLSLTLSLFLPFLCPCLFLSLSSPLPSSSLYLSYASTVIRRKVDLSYRNTVEDQFEREGTLSCNTITWHRSPLRATRPARPTFG